MAEYNPSKIIKDGNTYNFRDDTKIPLAGSNAISGSLIPSTDGTVNLGGSSYQWNNAYIKSLTINGVACGDILTHNASEFVPRSGGAVITGTAFSKNVDDSEFRIDGGSSWNKGGSVIVYGKDRTGKVAIHAANGSNETYFSFYPDGYITFGPNFSFNTDVTFQIGSSVGTYFKLRYDGMVWSNSNKIYPANNLVMELGSDTSKWKSFNGVNPGALSLPGTSVNVDTTNWVLDGSNVNIFTPASDGWLGIQATDTVYDQMHYVFVGRNDSVSYHSQNVLSPINALWNGEYHGCVFIPVIKNVGYDIRCICSTIAATFYPCQGNV